MSVCNSFHKPRKMAARQPLTTRCLGYQRLHISDVGASAIVSTSPGLTMLTKGSLLDPHGAAVELCLGVCVCVVCGCEYKRGVSIYKEGEESPRA